MLGICFRFIEWVTAPSMGNDLENCVKGKALTRIQSSKFCTGKDSTGQFLVKLHSHVQCCIADLNLGFLSKSALGSTFIPDADTFVDVGYPGKDFLNFKAIFDTVHKASFFTYQTICLRLTCGGKLSVGRDL
jgi:hypothetical protein